MRKNLMAVAAALLMGLPAVSMATLVSGGSNNPLAFSWSYNTGSSLLTGSGSMLLSGFNSSFLTVSVTLNNTSALGGQGGERLTSFGFGIDPNASSVGFLDAADGGLINAKLGQNFPGIQGIEVCAFGGPNCAGGGNGGIYAGTSDSFAIVLGGNWGSSVNIDPIGLKYQTGYGSFEFSPNGGGGNLPEPSSIALAGLGFGILGFGLRRRRESSAPAQRSA